MATIPIPPNNAATTPSQGQINQAVGNTQGATQMSEADWARQVLIDLGAPTSQNNIDNIMRWMTAEEPTNNWFDRNNPLNASLGNGSIDGTGSYPSLLVGASYTAKMIQQANMSGIHQALMSDAPTSVFSAAVVESPWASSHYGGDPNHIANIAVPGGGPTAAGGQAPTGTAGVGGTNAPDAAGTSADAAQIYADLGWMAQISPELNNIITQGVAQGLPEAQIQTEIEQTNWFRSTSNAQRQWLQTSFEDPGTAAADIAQRKTDILNQASTLGVQLNDQQLTNLAMGDLSGAWDTQQLLQNVLGQSTYQGEQAAEAAGKGGDLASTMAAIKQQAAQYMIPMSDDSAYRWAIQMTQEGVTPGSSTNDGGLTAMLQQQASSRFPSLAGQIAAGVTPQQYFSSYQQQAANLLEVSPDQIDMMNNPVYSKMTDFVDNNGVARPMTLTEAAKYVRGLPQWQTTTNAMQSASTMVQNLLQTFGAIGQGGQLA